MSKAILVIDMPHMCSSCMLEQNVTVYHKSYSYCGATGIGTKHGSRSRFCPLKSLPIKKKVVYSKTLDYQDGYFAEGYNTCLNEILGGKDE